MLPLKAAGLIKNFFCMVTHLTKLGYVNMLRVIQNVVKTLKLVLYFSCDGVLLQ